MRPWSLNASPPTASSTSATHVFLDHRYYPIAPAALSPNCAASRSSASHEAISGRLLRGKPKFGAIIDALIDFLGDSRVIIHNASFDVGFLDHELARLRLPVVAKYAFRVEDSLALARQAYPGKRNSLDALCDRLGVDNSQRNLHGALLDARLLADVYLAMTRGQGLLQMTPRQADTQKTVWEASNDENDVTANLTEVAISDTARGDHLRMLENLSQQSGMPHRWH